MTREEKIEFLSRYKEIDNTIDRKLDELSMWKARRLNITPTYSDMPKGGQQDDKIQSAIEKIMSLEEDINADIDELEKTRVEIVRVIDRVPDRAQRLLLLLKYIDRQNNYTWDKIAVEMNYTWRHIMRLHNLALDSLKTE